MKDLKTSLIKRIAKSGIESKEVVLILDEIRKLYHNQKNVGDKVVSQKELSKSAAYVYGKSYQVSKDKKYLFYKGAWRVIRKNEIVYLGSILKLDFKRK